MEININNIKQKERRIIINDFDLEKAIKKVNKVAKDKYITLQARTKRKLGIKEKRLLKTITGISDED